MWARVTSMSRAELKLLRNTRLGLRCRGDGGVGSPGWKGGVARAEHEGELVWPDRPSHGLPCSVPLGASPQSQRASVGDLDWIACHLPTGLGDEEL